MKPFNHIVLGLFFSLTLFLIDSRIGLVGFGIVFLSSFLIDFDHYLYYVYVKKDINPFNSYRWFIKEFEKSLLLTKEQRSKLKGGIYIFHGLEVLILLFVLSFWFNPLIYVFVGFGFHLLLDLIYQPVISDKFDKISLINDFLKYKDK